jgi:peptidoglycan hydrolase CwlO-like protein
MAEAIRNDTIVSLHSPLVLRSSGTQGGAMAEQHSHQHPDYDQRFKSLEDQLKKLQKEVQDLKHKIETHDHPHSH